MNNKGFTLVEVIVGLTIAGVLMTLIYSVYVTGMESLQRGNAAMENYQRIRIVDKTFRKNIESCRIMSNEQTIEGTDSTLSLLRTGGPHGLMIINYEYAGNSLTYVETDYITGHIINTFKLLNDKEISFSYKKDSIWQSYWDGDGIPEGIRLAIEGYPPIIAQVYQGVNSYD